MLKVSKEKNIIKLENVKNLSYKKKDKTIKSLPNKKVVYIEGKPGKDGETPSTEQLLDIIKPLIPEVKDGKTPTKEELKEIIKTEIPTVEEIAKIVVPQIPVIKGDKGDKLKFSDLTIDERASLEGPRGVPGMTVRLSDIYEGTWSATGDYLVDEIVVYNDNTYFAKRRNKGVTPGTDDFIWQFLAPYTGGTTATPTLQEVTDEGNTTTNDITANSFIKTGGTSSEFLKADGSVDTTSYYPSSNPSGYTSNTGTVTGTGTTNELTYFTGSSSIGSLPVATYPSLTELSYVKGVTSAIQTQINTKESALTFSTGLTRATNTITNNLSTGVSGGQSVIGGTAASNALTLSSTSNATKGKIIMGTGFAYHENTQRLSVGGTTDLGFTLGVAGTLAAQQSVYFAQNSGNVTFGSTLNTGQVNFSVKQSTNTGLGWIFGYDSLSTNGFYIYTNETTASPNFNIYTGATQRLTIYGTTSMVLNEAGANFDIRMEGDTNANLFFLDASVDSIGIGHGAPDRLLHVEQADAVTNAVTYPFRVTHTSSGTVATNFGVGQEFEAENASNTNRVIGTHEFIYSDATNATEDATYKLRLIKAGTLTDALTVDSLGAALFAGDVTVPDEAYGAGWNGSMEVPTKNALYDKIETLGSGASIGGAMTGGTAGSVLFVDPDAIIAQNNQNLFWDNTLKSFILSSTLGSELITNGTFTGNATGWTVPTGWAYSANAVSHTSNGTGALTPSTALTTVLSGYKYEYSVTVSALTVGNVILAVGGVTLATISANGTYTGKFIATANTNLTLTPSNTSRLTVDNISLKRLSGGTINGGNLIGESIRSVLGALGTTPSDGFIAENTTAATSGNQQVSPASHWSGKGWSSGGAGSSQAIDFRKYLLPIQGIDGATGTLLTQISRNGAAYSTIHSQSTTGGIVQTILSGVSETVGYEMAASFSNTDTQTTQHIKLSNSGSNTWITSYFAGVQKGAMGWDNSGIMRFYASGNTYKFHSGVTGTTLIAEIYAGGFYNNGGNFNAGRVTAGSATVSPPTTFSNYGSTSLKTTIITTNTTLTDDYTQVIVDCSSNDVCTGTPSVTDCSTYTGSGQATCESHLPCAWNAGSSCSAFDNEFGMGTCSGTSGCSPATSSCSPYNSDQATCEAVPGNNYGGTCTWDAGSNTCPSQDCTTCASAGCSPNLGGDCSVFSDGGGDGTACYAAPCGACSYDSGSGVCSGSYFISCDGDNTTPSCNGTYYTGGCSGTYGAACTGTATCSGYGSETPCEAEAGCNWTSGVEITLPASPVEQTYWIAKDYTAGALTILPNSGQTVNNTTSITSSSTAGVGWMLTWIESKANWYIMSSH